MERGYFHSSRGYWQTVSDPTPEQIAAYPPGTVEIPVQPSPDHEWDGAAWQYVPPDPNVARALMTLTFAQLLIGLVAEGWISEQEGEAWLAGTLPAAVLAVIGTLPQGQRFAAKARAARPSVIERLDPLVVALAAAQGKSDAQLDAFFAAYAAV